MLCAFDWVIGSFFGSLEDATRASKYSLTNFSRCYTRSSFSRRSWKWWTLQCRGRYLPKFGHSVLTDGRSCSRMYCPACAKVMRALSLCHWCRKTETTVFNGRFASAVTAVWCWRVVWQPAPEDCPFSAGFLPSFTDGSPLIFDSCCQYRRHSSVKERGTGNSNSKLEELKQTLQHWKAPTTHAQGKYLTWILLFTCGKN